MRRPNPFQVEPARSETGPTVFLLDHAETRLAQSVIEGVLRSDAGDLPEFEGEATVTVSCDPGVVARLSGEDIELLRGLEETFQARILVEEGGRLTITAAEAELAEGLAQVLRELVEPVIEEGDEFPNAKVVKTTTFGAFVELAKGTDGLLHISNIAPGQRPDTVEEVLNEGDEIAVRVVEVDHERGRIDLRLASDPEIDRDEPPGASARGRRAGNRGVPRVRRERD